MAKKKGFNWDGITENFDGTFTAAGKREKRRVLKELHAQGIGVRSKRNSDGTWTITPSGTIRAPREKGAATPAPRYQGTPGRRLNTKESGFPVYPRGRGRQMQGGGGRPFPGSAGAPGRSPISSGISALNKSGTKAGEYLRKRAQEKEEKRKEEAEFQKNAKEVDEKMRKERIEQEIREQKETAQRQMEKDRLRREAMGQQPSDLKASLRAADVKTEQRRTDDIVRKQQEQRQQRQEAKMNQGGWSGGSAKAPEIPKQKIDPATLQHARESAVKGEE